MNPHYHPYSASELTSPHPPSPDNPNYHPNSNPPPPPHMVGNPNSNGPLSNGHNGPPTTPNPNNGTGEIHFGNVQQHHQQQHHHQQQQHHPSQHHQQQQHANPHQHHLTPTNNNNNNSQSVKICAGCGGKILERFLLHALDRYWHNSCLKCSCCGAMLADIGTSCFTKSGMILCKNDYMRLFGNSGACTACGQTIPASEFVMRTGVPQQPGAPPTHYVFHLKCFACSQCGSHLVPGDRYYMLSGKLVCEQDWHKLLKTNTTGGTVRKGKVGRPRRSRD